MADEEMDRIVAEIEKSIERYEKEKAKRTPEEEKRLDEMAEQTRLWEDWTDCDPVANPNPQPSKSRKGQK